jgi:hypothetical protein
MIVARREKKERIAPFAGHICLQVIDVPRAPKE